MLLWELIARDAERGAEVLIEEYGARLYATAFRLCQHEKDAEDLVSRTLTRVLEQIGSFRGESAFFTWMCSILANFYRMDMRRKAANAIVLNENLPENPDPRPNPSESLACADEAAVIRAAVDALAADLRAAIVLHYFDEMSVPEIAAALSVPEGTVYWRLHEGRRKIREMVAKVFGRDGI